MKYITPYKLFESKVKPVEKIDIYRDENYVVVAPLSFRASCKYGAFSKWCISAPSNNDIWDEENNPKIVMVIQRKLKYTDQREEIIHKFNKYQEDIDSGNELTEEQREEYLDFSDNLSGYDLRKIAIIKGKSSSNVELWDMNNIQINDKYGPNPYIGLYDLPIDDNVLDKIEEYLEE